MFDVFTSNYLTSIDSETLETVDVSGFAANLFFSAAPGVQPFIGAWRQLPQVDAEFNKDKQRTEFVTTARYGVKLFRPENLITVPTSTSV